MASFRVTSSEPAALDGGAVAQLQPSHQEMMQKVWTVSSNRKIETLELRIPGVVFIDHEDNLVSSPVISGQTQTEPESVSKKEDNGPVAEGKIVAQIVVTSDSIELLDSLEIVSLDVDKEELGFRFRVKNEDAELKGSILTQVFVSDKNALRVLDGSVAEVVIGESVLVENDPTADVKLSAFHYGSLFVSSAQGFTLRSLHASIDDGVLQIQAPLIETRENIDLTTGSSLCTIAVSADTIAAKEINFTVLLHGDIVVHSPNLSAKNLFSIVGFSGSINFVGDGHVKKQQAVVVKSGEINTGGIVADKAEAGVGWSGRILLSALNELEATRLFFGTIEYANTPPPTILKDTSFLWWKEKKTPGTIAKPAATDAASLVGKPYTFCEPPLRQPIAIHYRVEKSKHSEPQIVKPDANSWTARYSKLGWATGVVAVGAIVVIATRRRAARLT